MAGGNPLQRPESRSESWDQDRNFVLGALSRIESDLRAEAESRENWRAEHLRKHELLVVQVAKLQVRAGLVGLLGGLIPSIGALVVVAVIFLSERF